MARRIVAIAFLVIVALTACGGVSTNNNDGTFTVTSGVAVPATQTGTLIAALEGHPALDADANGSIDRIAVTNDFRYAAITGTLATGLGTNFGIIEWTEGLIGLIGPASRVNDKIEKDLPDTEQELNQSEPPG